MGTIPVVGIPLTFFRVVLCITAVVALGMLASCQNTTATDSEKTVPDQKVSDQKISDPKVSDQEVSDQKVDDQKVAVTIQEDEDPSFAAFASTSGEIVESQSGGIVVPILFSAPVAKAGTITVSFSAPNATYGTHFTTTPAAGRNVHIPVARNDVAAQFIVYPVFKENDHSDRTVLFTIASGGVVLPGKNVTYLLTIRDNDPKLQRVLISFGSADNPVVPGADVWNYANTDTPNAGMKWSDLVRSNGKPTTIDLFIVTPLSPQPLGAITGINSGVFPDNAMKEYWWVPGPEGGSRGFRLLQADNNIVYTIRIHGGTEFVSKDGKNTLTASVNGDKKSIDNITNNVTQVLQWTGISPDASIFSILLTDGEKAGFCPINVMEISWHEE